MHSSGSIGVARRALAAYALVALCACGDDDSAPNTKTSSGGAADAGDMQPSTNGSGGKRATGGAGGATPSGNGSGRHSISGSVTASVATGVAMTLSGAASAVVIPDVRGVYKFDYLADGDYVVTPSLFGYTFTPPSRAVKLKGKDAIAQDFAAIMGDATCMTGFVRGPIVAMSTAFNDVTSGDFDGDGKLDLVAIENGDATLMLGKGDGTLGVLKDVVAPVGARYITAADLDGDHKLDLIATAEHEGTKAGDPSQIVTLVVLLGHGDGTFDDAVEYTVAGGGDGTKATIGDFDGDKQLDAAVAVTKDKAIAVLLGKGDGAFADAVEYASGSTSRALTSADLNGDGKLDLINTSSTPIENSANVLLGNGDGTFKAVVDYPIAGKFPYSIVAGDFDRDGDVDLATSNNNGTNLSVLVGKGNGTFAASVEYMAGGMPFAIASGDFDGDGKLDLASANGAVVGAGVFLGAGDGTFGPMTATIAPATALVSGDFDGDGKLDLGVAGGGGAVILRNCR